VPVVAVSPIVGGRALRGSAGKMMRELGKEPSARAVATEYLNVIDGFVIDQEDVAFAAAIRSLGIQVMATNTIMQTGEHRVALARSVLDFARSIREASEAEVK
jgi:LPPG:FO 2-phospho-L-lactate transferase